MANVIYEDEVYLRPCDIDMGVFKGSVQEEALALQQVNLNVCAFGLGVTPSALRRVQEAVRKRVMLEFGFTEDELGTVRSGLPLRSVGLSESGDESGLPTARELAQAYEAEPRLLRDDICVPGVHVPGLEVDVTSASPAIEFLRTPVLDQATPVSSDGVSRDWSVDDWLRSGEAYTKSVIPTYSGGLPEGTERVNWLQLVTTPVIDDDVATVPGRRYFRAYDQSLFRQPDGDLFGSGFDAVDLGVPDPLRHLERFPIVATVKRMAAVALVGDVSSGDPRIDTMLVHVARNLVGRCYGDTLDVWPVVVHVSLMRMERLGTACNLPAVARSLALRLCYLFALTRLHVNPTYADVDLKGGGVSLFGQQGCFT